MAGAALRGLGTVDRGPPAVATLALACFVLWGPPSPRFSEELSAAVYDRRGELLGAAVSKTGQWRLPSSGDPPERYARAVLAFEDKRFYSHMGIDPAALLRAALQNVRAGEVRSGGSTLSMQVARLARPGSPRTLGEKAAEAVLALRLELLRGKKGVFRLYADNAPFGGNVVGLEAASFRFFGRPPASLSWAEAATLAVLPNAPSAAHPGKNRDALLAKRDRLLRKLRDRGELSEEDLALALEEPLPPEPYPLPCLAPHLVSRYIVAGAGRPGGPPARVETTLDASLQERATEILARRSERLAAGGVYNAACVVALVDTGEVLAYVGNVPRRRDADGGLEREGPGASSERGYDVDLVRARRSSGSLFKPFLYAAALDSGELGPRSVLPDLPTRYGSYEPENNLGTYSGAVRADEALARSLNVPFVRLLRSFGVERFRDVLVSTGMSTLTRRAEDYGLTLILGGAETSLWEMAGRFAALARTASEGRPSGSGQIFDLGATRAELAARTRRPEAFSPGAAALTLEALTRVARPEDEAAWEDYASARRIAWKTGTSFGYRDAWAIGVDGVYVVGVWVGNASGEGRPSLKGSFAAAPVLFDVFGLLAAGGAAGAGGYGGRTAEIAAVEDSAHAFKSVEVCAYSGWAAGPDCALAEAALVPAEAKPLPRCPYCASVALSADGKYRVRAEDEEAGSVRVEKRFVLPPGMEWYYKKNLDYRPLPPWKPGSSPSGSDRSLAILAPEEGSSIYVPIELSGELGATVFAAAHRDPGATVFWHIDGEYLGSTAGTHRIEARPPPGEHILTVVDDSGRSVSRKFRILSKE